MGFSEATATLLEPSSEVELADFEAQVQRFPMSSLDYDYLSEDRVFNDELNSLRREGDVLFAVRDFVGAIELYTRCITRKPPRDPAAFEASDTRRGILLLTYVSRSETWLWLQKYENALDDAVGALQFDSRHASALFCKGRSLVGLGRHGEACTVLVNALHLNPADEAIRDSLAKAKVGYLQSRDGVYSLGDFLLAGCQGPAPSCSDYVGPVEVQYVKSAGRGLVVTKDVQAGRLLLVSNALAVACSPTEFWTEARLTKQNHDFLVAELAEQVQNSRRRMAQVSALAHDPRDVMVLPELEIFQPEVDWTCGDESQLNPLMDVERISAIVRLNAFDSLKCIDPVPFGDVETESNSGPGAGIASSGIWVLPSFINHSCASNCNMMFIGKAMFIRASRDLAAGDELTLSYCDPYEPEEYRQDTLKWWKFHCKCERCLLEQTFENHEEDSSPKSVFTNFFSIFQKLLSSEDPLSKIYNTHRKLVEKGEVRELTSVVDAVEKLIETSASKVEAGLQNWLRSPFLEAYTACILVYKDELPRKVECLERALDIMLAVAGGDFGAMQISSTLLRDSKQLHGESSAEFKNTEKRVLDIFRAALGDHSKKFFLALIEARFNSENQAFG